MISGDVAWLVIASNLLLGERLDSLVSWLCRLVAFQYAISSHPWCSPCVEGAESRPPDRCGQPRQARDPVSTGAVSLVRAAATGAECQQRAEGAAPRQGLGLDEAPPGADWVATGLAWAAASGGCATA